MDHETEHPNDSTNESDAPDPRVQIELERLNHASEAINHLELQLDDARKTFRDFQEKAEYELAQLEKQIGSAVSKARTYYDARVKLREAKEILTKAKHRFERAQALHVAAKELAAASADYIDEAEQTNENASSWNETYRHALAQAADAEREKFLADLDQQRAEKTYSEIENFVNKFEKDYRRQINKSKPYYEMKSEYHKEVDFHKRKIVGLEKCVQEAKSQYHQSLRNLERISNEIHEQRNHQNPKASEVSEESSGADEEQILPVAEPMQSSLPSPPQHSNDILRSCLLRTETLPAGIFVNPPDRFSPEVDDHLHDQFILRSRSPPSARVLINSDSTPSRSTSVSSYVTEEEQEDRTGSLHVLSEEQIKHLASIYDQPSPEEKGTHQPQIHGLSADLLYSLSNPLSKLVLDN